MFEKKYDIFTGFNLFFLLKTDIMQFCISAFSLKSNTSKLDL